MTSTPYSTPPYEIIANCFKSSTIVPFLGAATSFVGAKSAPLLPNASQLAAELLGTLSYPGDKADELAKVSQYIEEIRADRPYLLGEICNRFLKAVGPDYSTAFTEFLTDIHESMMPKLIITTNYDVLVERTLERRGIPYVALCSIRRGTSKYAGRWLCYESVTAPLSEDQLKLATRLEDELFGSEKPNGDSKVIIYKLHGTAKLQLGQSTVDSIVLTESDYVDFLAKEGLNSPPPLLDRLRHSRLLFLGYSLTDWNLRVLLRRIQVDRQRTGEEPLRHWAFQKNPQAVECDFWHHRGVNVHNVSIDVGLAELQKVMQSLLSK